MSGAVHRQQSGRDGVRDIPDSASFDHEEVGAVDEGTAGKLAAVVAKVSCANSFEWQSATEKRQFDVRKESSR